LWCALERDVLVYRFDSAVAEEDGEEISLIWLEVVVQGNLASTVAIRVELFEELLVGGAVV